MKLALGTVQFGLPYGVANTIGKVSLSAAKEVVAAAWACDLDTLDTAIAYGESETSLGLIGTERFKVVTKLPPIPDQCLNIERWIFDQVTSSLQRLRVRNVFGLLLHRPDQLLGPNAPEIFSVLLGLKKLGYVKKIGISIYSPTELDQLIPRFTFDLVQAPFNVLDRRLVTSGWLERLKSLGVEVHTRSIFLQGLLLVSDLRMQPRFKKWSSLLGDWFEWCTANHFSPLQASLNFGLQHESIDRIVVGVDSVKQLNEIVAAARMAVPVPDILLTCSDDGLINPSRWKLS